jgi:transcriptional regulator with XRE-family HTH domain
MATKKGTTLTKNRLADLRKSGVVLSQEQVGRLLGIDAATVSRHESGARSMSRANIEAYALLFGVPTHEIFFVAADEPTQAE